MSKMDPIAYGQTMAGEQALMNALGALQTAENENIDLKREVTALKQENATLKVANHSPSGGGSSHDQQVQELLHVNHQWDLEYKEQEEAFRRYRIDSQQAQSENQAYIADLKQGKDYQSQEIDTLKYELSQAEKKIKSLQHKNRMLQEQLSSVSRQAGGGGNGCSQQMVKQLEEDNSLLKQQLTAFKEDFEAERRDRERLNEDKQSAALRYEAEITSLKLQLDRCRNELSHYTTEATRLGQQLRLKHQYEEDQYKRHLESRGYVSRSPNGPLPPLDPFVEHDPPSYNPQPNVQKSYSSPPVPRVIEPYTNPAPPTNTSPRPAPRKNLPQKRENFGGQLLARSSDGEDSRSAPASFEQEYPRPQSFEKQRSRTPTPADYMSRGGNPRSNGYSEATFRGANPNSQVRPQNNGYIMQNGHVATNAPLTNGVAKNTNDVTKNSHDFVVLDSSDITVQRVQSDGESSPARVGHVKRFTQPLEVKVQEVKGQILDNMGEPVQKIPPTQTKGRHKCPRCARRFQSGAECSDHKARCIS